MTDTQKKMMIRDIPAGYIMLNRSDALMLGLYTDDICELLEESSNEFAAARVTISDEVPAGAFVINERLADSIGGSEGLLYRLRKYRWPLNSFIKQIRVGVRDLGLYRDMDLEHIITTRYDEIKSFISRQIIFPGLKMDYREMGIGLEVVETTPPLKQNELALLHNVNMELFPLIPSSFNGILLIDASFSMDTVDIPVDGSVRQALAQLHQMTDYLPRLNAYIGDLEKQSLIKRLDAAMLCAMLYFAEKVARGKGEKIALIPYSLEAEPIEFTRSMQTFTWMNVSMDRTQFGNEDAAIILSAALLERLQNMDRGQTNISDALQSASMVIDEIGRFERFMENMASPNPTMIILLTDGDYTVPPNPVRTTKSVYATMSKIIIHTVGIGNEVDDSVLSRIAQLGKGAYFHATDLSQLLNFYSGLARHFKLVA